VHNNSQAENNPLVQEILKNRKGSIKNAPLPKGAPSWDKIINMTINEIEAGAKANKIGFKEIKKLLQDGRFRK
jgi:hypothetical protein